MKFKLIWYDMEEEKAVDYIEGVNTEEEAKQKGYEKYHGNPPGPMVSVVRE